MQKTARRVPEVTGNGQGRERGLLLTTGTRIHGLWRMVLRSEGLQSAHRQADQRVAAWGDVAKVDHLQNQHPRRQQLHVRRDCPLHAARSAAKLLYDHAAGWSGQVHGQGFWRLANGRWCRWPKNITLGTWTKFSARRWTASPARPDAWPRATNCLPKCVGTAGTKFISLSPCLIC